MVISFTNCSTWLSSNTLDFFMATTVLSGRIPLYTVPCPPRPRIRLSL
uniref:Uncharacterized protein n=1 Tax=Arundo donax TaxID=35708 RepID=A0A0A9A7P7_ARUDO